MAAIALEHGLDAVVSCVGWSDFVAATEAGAIDVADRSPFQQNRV